LKPRPGFWCFTYRGCFHDSSPATALHRIAEDETMSGHDGISDFGSTCSRSRRPTARVHAVSNRRGTGWPGCSTMALLAHGPDGPVPTERFEMFRECLQLAEAILFIQRAIEENKISEQLQQQARRYLDDPSEAFLKGCFGVRYIQDEPDEELLSLAGEVARTMAAR
jgi:hypothetical protein